MAEVGARGNGWDDDVGRTMGGERAGRGGSRGAAARRRPPLRRRTLRRWALPALLVAAVAFSMASAVKRGAHARALYQEIQALQRAERVTLERLTEERRRADSLSSRARIRNAAAELGLRPADDREITFLADVTEAF